MASGEIDVTPGRVLSTTELIDNSKLNDLGRPVLRTKAGAITARELADGSISSDKLDVNLEAQLGVADGSVTTAKIVDGAVTLAKLASDVTSVITLGRGYIDGLILANNGSDAVNDIDVAAGCCRDSTDLNDMLFPVGLTKRLDTTWVVGTNQGGLDTGAVANNTYHVFLIKRSDTGIVDVLFSLSATAPTMPASYNYKRRIGSITRVAGTIVAFIQYADTFMRASITDYNAVGARAIALLTLSVPVGIRIRPIMNLLLAQNASGGAFLDVAPGDNSAIITSNVVQTNGTANTNNSMVMHITTNTSAQVYFAVTVTGGTLSSVVVRTVGWIDLRGKDT